MPDAYLVINDLSGGVNASDSPFSLPETQIVDARNVEWYQATVARKRRGCTALSMTGVSYTGYLARHTPTATSAQLWMIGKTANTHYYRAYSAGWAWNAVTFALSTNAPTSAVSFNGKLYVAINEATLTANRLFCVDGTAFRTVGLAAPAGAPSVANTGSGSYPAILRYYKVSFDTVASAVTVFRSELSAATSFTPSGSGTAARVTKPSLGYAGDSPTHWTVWGSADGTNYYKLSQIVVGTTTYDDSAAPSSYSGGELAPDANTSIPFPSVTYLAVDDNRLLGARGALPQTTYQSRVWWSPVVGSSTVRDDERYLNTTTIKNYLDLDEQEDGGFTGFAAPVFGNVFVFKQHRTYKLVRTGNVDAPYQPVTLSKTVGCISNDSIVAAEDEDAGPCLYWLSERGPYRYGARGFQSLTRDLEALWPSYTTLTQMRGVYYADRHQIWWTGDRSTSQQPALIFDTRKGQSVGSTVRGGWSLYDGPLASATSICMWGETQSDGLGPLTPHFVSADVSLKVLAGDSGTSDNGTVYDAYLTTKPYLLGGPMANHGVTQVEVLAAAGGEIAVTLQRDFGLETRELTLDLEPEKSETRVIRQVEGLELSGAKAMQVTIGDRTPTDATWVLDQVVLKYRPEEPR